MPVELIWIVGLMAAGSCILVSAIYSEAKYYRQLFAKAASSPNQQAWRDRAGVK